MGIPHFLRMVITVGGLVDGGDLGLEPLAVFKEAGKLLSKRLFLIVVRHGATRVKW
ncbi:MAG: hypothetical protein P8J29_00930 [Rhodospirillales bacterium]|nr:hypothetical protein [Rhodospirillales bacterium]